MPPLIPYLTSVLTVKSQIKKELITLANILKYLGSTEYWHGLIVELSGIFFEILLLIILLPAILKILSLYKSVQTRSVLAYYFFQIHHRLLNILLRIFQIEAFNKLAHKYIPPDEIYPEYIYGNIQDKFEALKNTIKKEGKIGANKFIETLNETQINEYIRETDSLLSEIDRLMVFSIDQKIISNLLFESRHILYGVNNIFNKFLSEIKSGNRPDPSIELFTSFPNVILDYCDFSETQINSFIKSIGRHYLLSFSKFIPLIVCIPLVWPFHFMSNLYSKIRRKAS